MSSQAASGGVVTRFLPAGETALVVEFGTTIDLATNERVLAFDRALAQAQIEGIVETVPTYRSVMVHYDPSIVEPQQLLERLRSLPTAVTAERKIRRWIVPVCYAPSLAEDLEYVSRTLGIPPERVVALHSGTIYRIYMYGFAPGFAYLGGLSPELAISRRLTPRPKAEANSILIAGGQALITTVPMPTGWYVLGRTPERFFSITREPVFLAEVGDQVQFDPIDEATFATLAERAENGEVIARVTDPVR